MSRDSLFETARLWSKGYGRRLPDGTILSEARGDRRTRSCGEAIAGTWGSSAAIIAAATWSQLTLAVSGTPQASFLNACKVGGASNATFAEVARIITSYNARVVLVRYTDRVNEMANFLANRLTSYFAAHSDEHATVEACILACAENIRAEFNEEEGTIGSSPVTPV